jgi:sphingomyelin phosphodiesterase
MFPPPFVKEDNISWLYTALVRDWTKTGLPSYLSANISRYFVLNLFIEIFNSFRITFLFKSGAFYSIQLYPGLRLISLNTNYCPALNFWLIINSTDPLGKYFKK